jgi:predicted Zn-dependent peptidase
MPTEGVDINEAESEIWNEIGVLRREAANTEELEKLKNKYEANDSMEKTDYQHRAAQLAYFEMYGDATMIDHEVEHYRAVTPEQLKAACKKYLTKKNSCVLHYLARKTTD